MSKAPDQNCKYKRRMSMEQADASVMYLRVMFILRRQENKVTQAYIFREYFNTVLLIKYFIDTTKEREARYRFLLFTFILKSINICAVYNNENVISTRRSCSSINYLFLLLGLITEHGLSASLYLNQVKLAWILSMLYIVTVAR